MRLVTFFFVLSAAMMPVPLAAAGPGHCPPGLAKKNPPCIPPGQARGWSVGDRYDGRFDPAEWLRYDLDRPRRNESWVRVGDTMLRVNRESRIVIDLIRLIDLATN